MGFRQPPSRPYKSAVAAVTTWWAKLPDEGPQCVPAEILWGDYNDLYCVRLNMTQQGSNLPFSKIVALVADHSDCGCDVRYSFPDTGTTITVAAGTPYAVVPVISNGNEVYIQANLNGQLVLDTDVIRFQLHNTMPPPVVIPTSEEQSTAAVGGIDMATASTQLVAANISGTLENLFLGLAMNATNSGSGTWKVKDGTGKVIAQGSVAVSSGTKYSITLCNLTGLHVRFKNGLTVDCTQTAVLGAVIDANAYYKVP